ncbi:MAG: hypothetical protein KGJ80_11690, partial [Chloroflexota bacterium]|nr:hypothetical protein [Chloroflexota bacterium]
MTGVAETHLVETNQIARQRAVMWVFAGAALAAGAFAALGSAAWLGSIAAVLLFSVAALTLPLPWVAGLLAALIPFQFYFNVPGSSFTLRGAVLFVFVAAMRVSVRRFARAAPWTKLDRWMLPATIFLFAAVAAALGAANRY